MKTTASVLSFFNKKKSNNKKNKEKNSHLLLNGFQMIFFFFLCSRNEKTFLFQSSTEFCEMQDIHVWRILLETFLLSPSKYIKSKYIKTLVFLIFYIFFFCLSKHVSFRSVLVNCEWNRVDFLINL